MMTRLQKTPLVSRLRLFVVFIVFSGCAAGLSQSLQQSLAIVVPTEVDFAELHYYAERSNSAYSSEEDIRNDYPLVTRVATVQPVNVRYFLETDVANNTQTLSVRGTAERANVWQDIETALIPDSILGLPLHRGFQSDARALLDDVRPYLREGYSLRVTGHSLGGAAAAILGLYLDADGFDVERVVTFGEPRFTTVTPDSGALDIALRVVNDRDVVPMLPPNSVFGRYKHASAEVILRPGADYVYLTIHDEDRLSVGSFWRNITNFSFADHHMEGYLANIEEKMENGATQVPYFQSSDAKTVADSVSP